MRYFAMKMLDGLPEHFVGWPVTGIQSTFEIHPGLHFGLFHRECCRPLQLSEPQMQRRVVFVLKSCFFGYCVCLNKISHLLVPPKVNFLPFVFSLFSTPSRFRTHNGAAGEATAVLNICHSTSGFMVCSEQRQYAVGKRLSFIYVRQDLPLYSVGSPGPARLCRPGSFSDACCRPESGDRSTGLYLF